MKYKKKRRRTTLHYPKEEKILAYALSAPVSGLCGDIYRQKEVPEDEMRLRIKD